MNDLQDDLVQRYKQHFADILSDVDVDDPKYGDALVAGFVLSIKEWHDYHLKHADAYKKLGERISLSLPL